MNDLANYSQGFAAPVEEHFISTQSTVGPEVQLSHAAATVEESQTSRVEENEGNEGSQLSLENNQERSLLNETVYVSYGNSQVGDTSYEVSSQQILQPENTSSQTDGLSAAHYVQYQYPPQPQGYPSYPQRSDFGIAQTYSMMRSQQYLPLPQYTPPSSQNPPFPTPPVSAGQTPFSSPPNAATSYSAPPVMQTLDMGQKTEIKKHQCVTCGKCFLRPSALDTHTRIHTGETPFYCRLAGCRRGVGGEPFNVKSNCVRHEKGHIAKGELQPLVRGDTVVPHSYL